MGRAPCCDKANVKKGPWSPEEDAKLKSYIELYGTGGNWIALPQKIGLKRCGKSCRLRWLNYLRPNIRHGGFSEEEDNIICSLYISIGSRWSIIAAQLPGRTDNDIKNYWNTRLKKKLLGCKLKKDPSQNRRTVGGMKPEARRVENGPNMYWPEPATGPMYTVNQAEHHVSDEHSSIRRLLMKLGGRFSTETVLPLSVPQQQQVLYDASVAALMDVNSGPAPPSGYNLNEFDDMFGSAMVKLEGLDCFFGESSNIGTSSSDHSTNWSEVSPNLIDYQPPPMIPTYTQMQPCIFEEPVHL